MTKVAVLGAGAGGLAVAADLATKGHTVNLFELERFKENILTPQRKGTITIQEGENEKLASLNTVTTNPEEALKDIDMAFIVVPCYGQRIFAELALPSLHNGQILCYMGEGGGTLELLKVSREKKVKLDFVVGETNTLPYSARIMAPGGVRVVRKKGGTIAASLPARNGDKLVSELRQFWPFIAPAEDVLETVLVNFNVIDHVATFILNWGRLEGEHGKIFFWKEGATPSVARVIEAVDNEILRIREAWGLKNLTRYRDWLVSQGMLEFAKESTYDAIQSSALTSVEFGSGPNAARHRYITEDIPYALVLIASIGDILGVATPVIDSLITLASVGTGIDFWREGRSISKLQLPTVKDQLKSTIRNGP